MERCRLFCRLSNPDHPVDGRTDFVITLEHDYILLDDVIVTALGLQKKDRPCLTLLFR